MASWASPSSSARAAEASAETTVASRITSSAASGSGALRVLVHHAGQQVLVQASPVHADAHWLAVPAGSLDHLRELRVALAAAADIAGIDAVLGERLGAVGVRREQLVAVEVEVADDRHVAAGGAQAIADVRHGRG